ncbi:TPA: zeta toxin family protein [Enterococcus faecium]
MDGSSGAGETKILLCLTQTFDTHVMINADYFRIQFPDYSESNSSVFRKASSWIGE